MSDGSSAPGLYDQAASEMVLISLGFEANASWHCVEGGAFEIARRMKSALRNPNAVELGKVVTGMSYTNASDPKQGQVAVTVSGEAKQRTYEAVFNSAPLGAIHKMQLEGLELDWGTKLAIRNLSYGGSCKIAVRFRTLWWMQNGLDITRGGQSHSDLPIRCCVYPSYNIYDDPTKPGVLLVSYTYYQDAERMGALISRQAAENEPLIKELVIHDLARLHAKTGDESDYERLRHIIADNWLDYHAYNWHQNPFSVGAVAYFRPGQFSGLYSSLTQSDGRHVIIGEAASAHHAWMVGALESAVRGVYQFVHAHRTDSAAAAAATLDFEHNNIPGPFGPLPAEFNRT